MKGKITGLGPIRIFDKESGDLLLEGQLTGYTFKDERGQAWKVKTDKPKKCPHCGATLEEQHHESRNRMERKVV